MQPMTHNHTRETSIFYNEHSTECTNCQAPFSNGMCTHLGYLKDGSCAVLCDTCSHLLKETIVRYHWMEKEYASPLPDDKLWRYMDLSKFISLVSSKTLFFASADSFDDPFEGAKGIDSRKGKWDEFYLEFFREAIKTVPEIDPSTLTETDIEKDAQRLLREMSESGKLAKQHTYISCWHHNEQESEAMWRLYSKDVTNAVAIQTTANNLYLSLDREPTIDIGKVKYIDFEKRFSSVNGAFWYKRKSFEHEREVRAILQSYEAPCAGHAIPVDINVLINGVYISPYAPKWFADVVQSVVDKYAVRKPVYQSRMLLTPFF